MKNLIAAVLLGLLLLAGLIVVSIPANRDVVPGIQNYFSLQTGIWQNARNAEFPADIVLQTRGADGDIRIVRGGNGIPRIIANSKQDAIFALGYISAYDRYFQMRLHARIVEGRVSEWLGSAYVGTDRAFLTLGLEESAWNLLRSLPEDQYEYIARYASGVNTYINQNFTALKPIEFKLQNLSNNYWRPVDGLRIAQLLAYQLTFSDESLRHQPILDAIGAEQFRNLYMRTYPGDWMLDRTNTTLSTENNQKLAQNSLNLEPVLRALDDQRNQRNRIPAGRAGQFRTQHIITGQDRTERNQPVMALDFHHQATIPSQFYEVHIELPNQTIYGITIPGFPGLLAAYNGQISWAIGNTPVDQIDFVTLEITPDHNQYRLNDEWVSFKTERHNIPVAGGRTVRHRTRSSEHGPVLFMDNFAVAMQWNVLQNPLNPALLWNLMELRTIHEINEETDQWNWPVLALSATDRDGGMLSRLVGSLPIRRTAVGVHEGNDPATVWREYASSRDLPRVVNPASGILVYSGQNPNVRNNRLYLGYNWPKPWQTERLYQLLSERQRHSADHISTLLLDDVINFQHIRPHIARTVDQLPSNRFRSLLEQMLQWDYSSHVNSSLPVVVDNYLRIFRNKVYPSQTQTARPSDRNWYYYVTQQPAHAFFDKPDTPRRENATDIILESLREAHDITILEHGTIGNWNWGSVNRLRISHTADAAAFQVMNGPTIGRSGFNTTINPSYNRNATSASVLRVVVDFGSSDSAIRTSHLGGITENPFSSHYGIRVSQWLNGNYQVRRYRPLESSEVISTITMRSSGR